MCDRCGEMSDATKAESLGLNVSKTQLSELLQSVFGHDSVGLTGSIHVMDVTSWNFTDRILGKIDPTMKTYTVLGETRFLNPTIPYRDSVYSAIKSQATGTNAHIFTFDGAKFLSIELRSAVAYDLCREYVFYEEQNIAKKLFKRVSQLNRAGKSLQIYDGVNVPLSIIAKMPYIVPSKMWAQWKEYVEPQIVRKEVYNHVLFHGRPGSGKTAFCRWAATHYPKWKFIFVQPQSISKVGAVSEAYEWITRYAPAVAVFEDIDLIGQNRGDTSYNPSHALGELLNCLDGVEPRSNVLTIASTNNPAALDPAVVRAGRLGIPLTMEYTKDEKVRMLRSYYSFPKLTDDQIMDSVGIMASDSAADLKMIAKVYQVYEEFEKRACTEETLRGVAKMITTTDKSKFYVPMPDVDDMPRSPGKNSGHGFVSTISEDD